MIELAGLQRLVNVYIVLGDHLLAGFAFVRRHPAFRRPVRRRHAISESGKGHHEKVDHAKCEEGLRHADRTGTHHIDAFGPGHDHLGDVIRAHNYHFNHLSCLLDKTLAAFGDELHLIDRAEIVRGLIIELEEEVLERRTDHRAPTKAHDGHAGGHPATVREPSNQGAHGRDVPKPKAAAANHSVAEIDEPELVQRDAEAPDDIAAAPTASRHKANLARTDLLKPFAPERGRKPQKNDGNREDPQDLRERPVCRRRGDHPEGAH